jgi:hypothetical protein
MSPGSAPTAKPTATAASVAAILIFWLYRSGLAVPARRRDRPPRQNKKLDAIDDAIDGLAADPGSAAVRRRSFGGGPWASTTGPSSVNATRPRTT